MRVREPRLTIVLLHDHDRSSSSSRRRSQTLLSDNRKATSPQHRSIRDRIHSSGRGRYG
jgi:hypothetical protein